MIPANVSGKEPMKSLNQDQSGVVSIIVTTILIIILSLLVLAFSQVSRREQRESLDDQLSTQAFYAAESGVNVAKAALQAYISANPGTPAPSRTNCNDAVNYPQLISGSIGDPSANVSYTCVTVDPSPTQLIYTLGTNATAFPLTSSDGNPITSITITWPETNPSANLSGCKNPGTFVPSGSWTCPFGGIRMDLVYLSGGYSRAALDNPANAHVAFIMPTTGGGSTALDSVAAATCTSATSLCSVTFSGLNQANMYMRLSPLYVSSIQSVTVTGREASGAVQFNGAQAQIDSTGKAQDVLRRIRVSAPLFSANGGVPNQALVSGDSVCKRFSVATGYFHVDQAMTDNGQANPLCSN